MRRFSLRARLVLAVLVLATVGLVVANVVTYASLDSFLIQRTDNSLGAAHRQIEHALTGPGGVSQLADLTRSLPGLFIEARTTSGHVLFADQVMPFGEQPPARPLLPKTIHLKPPTENEPDRVAYFTVHGRDSGLRYRVRASLDPGSAFVLVIATSLSSLDSTLHRLLLIELLVTAGVLIGIALLGLWVVRLGLRPLDEIEQTAEAIAAGDLTRRIDVEDDHTEVGRLGRALNAMLGHIESAFRAQERSEQKLRRFLADASHELRTPLAAVRAYADLFKRGADRRPEDLKRAMEGISRESERMSYLVDDLLLLARLDEGHPLQREPVDLTAVVRDAVETARTMDPRRTIELEAEDAQVLGDRQRLRQVMDNLLGNARVHTPADKPVHVTVAKRNGNALVRVEDSGPGLTEEERERVFERFYRADPARARARGGAGLGLSIVSAVAEAHDGEVAVQSVPGDGATFEVSLPLYDAKDA